MLGNSIMSISKKSKRKSLKKYIASIKEPKFYIVYLQFVELELLVLCQVGLVVSVSASHTGQFGFAPRPSHTKDHHKNGTNCLPA